MPQATIDTFFDQPAEVGKLNQWIFDNIEPFIKGRTLEMHSGTGAISALFIERGLPLHVSDLESANRDHLRKRFQGSLALRGVHKIDYFRQDFKTRYQPELVAVSTILALNIIEHGYYKQEELDNVKQLLTLGGHLIVAFPSLTAPYPGYDQDLEEWKSYDRKPLKKLLTNCQILKVRYFRLQKGISMAGSPDVSMIVVARKIA